MYIIRLYVENIRTFDEIEINFSINSYDPDWVMILGNNGVGKSTLLRSIALGLCDELGTAGLLRELPGDLRKNPEEDVKIHIDLVDEKEIYRIKTKIHGISKKTEKIHREYFKLVENIEISIEDKEAERSILDNLFICGYGAGRGADGTEDYLEYSIVDAVYTLFRYDQPLQNPELGLRRLIEKTVDEMKKTNSNYHSYDNAEELVLNWIKPHLINILLLDKNDNIKLKPTGLWVETETWGEVNLVALGDGYKSTLNH